MVISPWAATIRYTGPLLDYGNVMILEPGGGYLLVLAGLEQVYGTVGDVVARGAALGLMGGFLFVLGWRHRDQSHLAYFGALAVGWALARYVFDFAWTASLWVPLAGSLAGAVLALLAGCSQAPQESAKHSGLALANMDTQVKPGDDFFRYVNGKWLATAKSIGYRAERFTGTEIAREVAPWRGQCPVGHEHYRYRKPTRPLSCGVCSPGALLRMR